MIGFNDKRKLRKELKTRKIYGRRLAIEPLEDRLALTWVGIPPTTITPPSSAVAVTLNAQHDAVGSATIASTEVDYYSFIANTTGTYIISSTTPSSNLDTVLGVFSATGQRIAYNDDIAYPSNTDSSVTLSLVTGSRYYVGITNYSTTSRGAYTWKIDGAATTTVPTDDSYENNDTFATASNLGTLTASQTISSLVMADAADWYRFTTSTTGTSSNAISIAFQNSQGNLQLALYNASGALISTSTGTGNSESVSLNGLAAGTYYVDVFGANGATNPNYSLTVAAPTPTTTTPSTGGFQITLNMTGLTTSEQAIFQQAAARWAQVITGDLPNATYRGQTVDDMLISASATSIDGVGGILGQSGPDAFRAGTDLPYHGVMQFDSADMASMEQSGLLLSVILHEMGHVLGIGTIWEDKGLLSGAGTSNPIFTGANATAQYNQIFGTNARGVPVEATGGSGTADSHWRETVFTNELMTGWAGPGTNLPLSRVTIGSLADLGYTVNYAAADAYTPSSSAIVAARTASSTSLAATRSNLFGLIASDDRLLTPAMPAEVSFNLTAAGTLASRASAAIQQQPMDADLADSVMSQAWDGSSRDSSLASHHSTDDSANYVDDMWGDPADAWDLSLSLAVS
jgi:hypothetical protein